MTAEWALDVQMPAIFDTGTSLIYVPKTDSGNFFYRLLYGKTYEYADGFVYVDCDDKDQYPDVHLLINDRWFVVTHEDYFGNLEGSCFISFVEDPNNDAYWLLGDSFLRGYYSIHDNQDHANARIGFAPHSSSPKPFITSGTVPAETATDLIWERTWIFDWYNFWQIDALRGTILDSKWWY